MLSLEWQKYIYLQKGTFLCNSCLWQCWFLVFPEPAEGSPEEGALTEPLCVCLCPSWSPRCWWLTWLGSPTSQATRSTVALPSHGWRYSTNLGCSCFLTLEVQQAHTCSFQAFWCHWNSILKALFPCYQHIEGVGHTKSEPMLKVQSFFPCYLDFVSQKHIVLLIFTNGGGGSPSGLPGNAGFRAESPSGGLQKAHLFQSSLIPALLFAKAMLQMWHISKTQLSLLWCFPALLFFLNHFSLWQLQIQ